MGAINRVFGRAILRTTASSSVMGGFKTVWGSSLSEGGALESFSPVNADGSIRKMIFIGDDYRAADGRAFQWTVTTTVAVASCFLGFYKDADNNLIKAGTVADNGVTLSFDLLKAETQGLEPGEYEYSVEMRDANGIEITPVHSLNGNAKRYARFVRKRT